MSDSIAYKISASFNFVKIFQSLESKKPPTGYPKELPDSDKVTYFITEYLNNGWSGNLLGRNKPSWDVPTDDPEWLNKVTYARKHNLYHYHVGIPTYTLSSYGDLTSEWIIHYQNLGDQHIKLVDLDFHPPMTLPKIALIQGDLDLT
jgi:hypothetical protein